MDYKAVDELFNAYCFGPADLLQIRKGDSTMWLSLRDSVGRNAIAIYHDCVYWRLDQRQTGIHLSLVQRVTAQELLQQRNSISLLFLQKNTENVEQLLLDWEQAGLSFFLHQGNRPGLEFLVVARSLEYHELT